MLVIALKDDHVSAWEAVYAGARHLGAEFVLGGSGHNAGVINPPSRNKHGYWTGAEELPEDAEEWLASATKHEGSWWPWWTKWLTAHGSKQAGRGAQARQADRARARLLCDDGLMDAVTHLARRPHGQGGPRRPPAPQPAQGAAQPQPPDGPRHGRRAARMARRSRGADHPHRPYRGPRLLRRRRRRQHRPGGDRARGGGAVLLLRRISPQPPRIYLPQARRRLHGRGDDGRRGRDRLPVPLPRRDRADGAGHARDRDRHFPRCRRRALSVAAARADGAVPRADRRAARRVGVPQAAARDALSAVRTARGGQGADHRAAVPGRRRSSTS